MAFDLTPRDIAVAVFVMILWGVNFVVAKLGLEELPPMVLIALRFGVVALLLGPFVPLPSGHWRGVIGVSFTLGFLHFALMFIGLKYIDASTAAIVVQLQVPIAALFAAVFFKDYLGWRRCLGLVIAFGGVILIAGEPRFEGQLWAILLIVGGATSWALSAIQIKKLTTLSGMTLNVWIAILATPQLILASLVFETGQWQALTTAGWKATFSVLYQSVLVYGLGYFLWFRLVRRYQVNQTMPFTLLAPLVGVISGIVFLGEPLTWSLVLGGLLTLSGVAIIILRRPETAAGR